jgi:predicted nucleic-acid-binding protein
VIGIDANVLVRYLAHDDPVQTPMAIRLFERRLSASEPGHLSIVTLAEALWVLARRFRATPAELIEILQQLLSDPRLVVQHERAAWLAVEAAQEHGVDLADALIAFLNDEAGCVHTLTFDHRAARLPAMKLLQ